MMFGKNFIRLVNANKYMKYDILTIFFFYKNFFSSYTKSFFFIFKPLQTFLLSNEVLSRQYCQKWLCSYLIFFTISLFVHIISFLISVALKWSCSSLNLGSKVIFYNILKFWHMIKTHVYSILGEVALVFSEKK